MRDVAGTRLPRTLLEADVRGAALLFDEAIDGKAVSLNGDVRGTFRGAGHALESAKLKLAVGGSGQPHAIVLSGDVGQWDRPIVEAPSVLTQADYVVMESTYVARNHEGRGAVEDQLDKVINETVAAGGHIMI